MVIVIFIGLFVLGFLALGIDVGYLFHEKRMAAGCSRCRQPWQPPEEGNAGNTSNEQVVANAYGEDEWIRIPGHR